MPEPDNIPSVAVIGGACVGKTACVKSFIYDRFSYDHQPTIQDDYVKSVIYGNVSYEVHIWDTAGDPLYQSTLKDIVKQVNAIAVFYSVDSRKSLERSEIMVKKEILDQALDVPIVLIGNKKDLPKEKWDVVQKDIDSFLEKIKLSASLQCSAKTGKDVNESLNVVCGFAIDNWKNNSVKRKDSCILS